MSTSSSEDESFSVLMPVQAKRKRRWTGSRRRTRRGGWKKENNVFFVQTSDNCDLKTHTRAHTLAPQPLITLWTLAFFTARTAIAKPKNRKKKNSRKWNHSVFPSINSFNLDSFWLIVFSTSYYWRKLFLVPKAICFCHLKYFCCVMQSVSAGWRFFVRNVMA